MQFVCISATSAKTLKIGYDLTKLRRV